MANCVSVMKKTGENVTIFARINSKQFEIGPLEPNILNWSVSWFPTTLGQIVPSMSVSSFLLVSFGHLIS